MTQIWVISDTHFGHDNIIRYCNRPFENSYYMNQCIRDNWNSLVKPGDKVYHLGDVYMGKNWTGGETIGGFLASLNGSKRLILGNHDNGKDQILQQTFKKIDVWRVFKEHGLLLTHIPAHESSFEKWGLNAHGHIHQHKSPTKLHRNVCVEMTDYKPVPIEEIK